MVTEAPAIFSCKHKNWPEMLTPAPAIFDAGPKNG